MLHYIVSLSPFLYRVIYCLGLRFLNKSQIPTSKVTGKIFIPKRSVLYLIYPITLLSHHPDPIGNVHSFLPLHSALGLLITYLMLIFFPPVVLQHLHWWVLHVPFRCQVITHGAEDALFLACFLARLWSVMGTGHFASLGLLYLVRASALFFFSSFGRKASVPSLVCLVILSLIQNAPWPSSPLLSMWGAQFLN